MEHLVIFGGTGFIGRHLIDEVKGDYKITVVSRSPNNVAAGCDSKILHFEGIQSMANLFNETDAIINLAGENVGEKWTKKKKESIKNSRLNVDKLIVSAFELSDKKPHVIIQGSGMGVYGTKTSDAYYTEKSDPGGPGFLTKVGIDHEQAIAKLENQTRLVYIRTGLVLDGREGALPPMALPFKFFAGGPVGTGKQWLSWIHIKDEIRAIRFLLEKKNASGAYNLTAPNPVRQKYFAKQLGKTLNRPSFMPAPAFMLKMAIGEMADELLLNGRRVIPERLLKSDFQFNYFHIEEALKDIFTK